MIQFKSKLDDHKTEKIDISIEGVEETVEVMSSVSRAYRNASAEFIAKLDHLKKNQIALTKTETKTNSLGEEFEVQVDSDFICEVWSAFASQIIVGWDNEDRRKQLADDPEFCVYVRDVAQGLGQEFADLKKT